LARRTSRQSEAPQKKNRPSPSVEDLRNFEKARLYIELADSYLESIGYTEHGFRHCDIVSRTAQKILAALSYEPRAVELAAVAGFLHDIGNMAGRLHHHQFGAVLAKEILDELGFHLREAGKVMAAIVIHEEDEGLIKPDPIAAALLLADKSDVHRSRVRSTSMLGEDIHDRVNYAATESELSVDAENKLISLSVTIDTRISQVIEYFEIFLTRMVACRKAARALGCEFQLYINKSRMA
jgi:metal-dependent HD superfamily phosphatase/phosphodiesterase